MNRSSNYSGGYSNDRPVNSNCNGMRYVIQKGDTLYSISRRYDVPLALVLRANPYVDVYNLQIGDEICVPSAQESRPPVMGPGPVRPPVIEGPGPVRPPVTEGPGPVRPPAAEEPGPVRPPVMQEPGPVRPPVMQEPGPVRPPVMQEPGPVRPSMDTGAATPTQNNFSFNYYNNAPARDRSRARREDVSERRTTQRPRTESAERTRQERRAPARPAAPVKPAAPAKRMTPTRQTMPVVERPQPRKEAPVAERMQPRQKEMPVRITMPVVEKAPARQTMPVNPPERMIPRHYIVPMDERPARKTRMVAPVRIITQPMAGETACAESEKDRCDRWCSYQDRERFHTIMNYDDTTTSECCKKLPKCTQSVTRPTSCEYTRNSKCGNDDDNMTIVSYVSRDEDTLQDILDYFTIDVADLFQFNVPDTIRLKPGCMIHVPGKGDDR